MLNEGDAQSALVCLPSSFFRLVIVRPKSCSKRLEEDYSELSRNFISETLLVGYAD